MRPGRRDYHLVRDVSNATPAFPTLSVVVVPLTRSTGAGHRRSDDWAVLSVDLSGQVETDELLVDVRKHWYGIEVLDEEALQVRVLC